MKKIRFHLRLNISLDDAVRVMKELTENQYDKEREIDIWSECHDDAPADQSAVRPFGAAD